MPLQPGTPAPRFDLPAIQGDQTTRIRLEDFLGKKHMVITFHPLDWTPT